MLPKMLCGTPITKQFSAVLSHFSKIIFEKRLIRQSQRCALPAGGWDETTPLCRNQLQAKKQLKKRGAYHHVRLHALLGAFVFYQLARLYHMFMRYFSAMLQLFEQRHFVLLALLHHSYSVQNVLQCLLSIQAKIFE